MQEPVTAGTRIPLEAMKAIITAALEGLDLTHDTAWIQPESCSCHAGAQSCLLPADEGSCQGHTAEVPTPPEHVVTAEILCSALPVPDSDGTIDTRDAALSVLRVIEARLAYPYSLRADHLVKRLTEDAELYEQQAGLTESSDVPEDAAVSALRCQVCSGPLPAGCKASRRTCSDRCRQQLRRIHRRELGGHGRGPATVRP